MADQSVWHATDGITFSNPSASPGIVMNFNQPTPFLEICKPGGAMLARIDMNSGTIEYGPDYSPDEAARIFWDALAACARLA